MHGLVICAFEGFVRNTYGPEVWGAAVSAADAETDDFEPMFHYEDALAEQLVSKTAERLGKPVDALLEDFGTYLVAHPASERVRRLLRFGGVDFEDFLASLEDLSGRVRLAVPDLEVPDLEVDDLGGGEFRLSFGNAPRRALPVLVGLLTALADDYGALVMLDRSDEDPHGPSLHLRVLERAFSQGRGFALAQRMTG